MADLFDIDGIQSSVEKLQYKKTPKTSGGLNAKIMEARNLVETALGKYKSRVKLITTPEQLKDYFATTGEVIAIDTETTGLNFFTDKIVGISMSDGTDGVYLPINHINYVYGGRTAGQLDIEDIKTIFADIMNSRKWVYHNAKFDLNVFETAFGFKMPPNHWDTLIFAHLYKSDEEHNLKYLYNKYIAEEDEGVNRFSTLFDGLTFDLVPIDVASVYAGKDAIMTYQVYKWQEEKLENELSYSKELFLDIENPLAYFVGEMQRTGVHYDMTKSDSISAILYEKLAENEKVVFSEIDKYKDKLDEYRISHPSIRIDNPINLKSDKQLGILFYEIIKYKTKSGKGTGKEILLEINTPLTLAILEMRTTVKLIDSFILSLPKFIEPTTGKIHGNMNQEGTETGRFSSSKPNLQQIPSRNPIGKKIRTIFKASPRSCIIIK